MVMAIEWHRSTEVIYSILTLHQSLNHCYDPTLEHRTHTCPGWVFYDTWPTLRDCHSFIAKAWNVIWFYIPSTDTWFEKLQTLDRFHTSSSTPQNATFEVEVPWIHNLHPQSRTLQLSNYTPSTFRTRSSFPHTQRIHNPSSLNSFHILSPDLFIIIHLPCPALCPKKTSTLRVNLSRLNALSTHRLLQLLHALSSWIQNLTPLFQKALHQRKTHLTNRLFRRCKTSITHLSRNPESSSSSPRYWS